VTTRLPFKARKAALAGNYACFRKSNDYYLLIFDGRFRLFSTLLRPSLVSNGCPAGDGRRAFPLGNLEGAHNPPLNVFTKNPTTLILATSVHEFMLFFSPSSPKLIGVASGISVVDPPQCGLEEIQIAVLVVRGHFATTYASAHRVGNPSVSNRSSVSCSSSLPSLVLPRHPTPTLFLMGRRTFPLESPDGAQNRLLSACTNDSATSVLVSSVTNSSLLFFTCSLFSREFNVPPSTVGGFGRRCEEALHTNG
jgi:hypothetical protein